MALAARLGQADDLERVFLATVDVPYGLIRRHLLDGTLIPASDEDLVTDATSALLQSPANPR